MHIYIKRLLKGTLTYDERYCYISGFPHNSTNKQQFKLYLPKLFDFLQNSYNQYQKRDVLIVLEEIIPEVIPQDWANLLMQKVSIGINRRNALRILKKIQIPPAISSVPLQTVIKTDPVNKCLAIEAFHGVQDVRQEQFLLELLLKSLHSDHMYDITISVCYALKGIGSISSISILTNLKQDFQIKEIIDAVNQTIQHIYHKYTGTPFV